MIAFIVDDSADITWLTDEQFSPLNVKKIEKILTKFPRAQSAVM